MYVHFRLKLKDLFIGIDAVLKINANGLNMTDIDINIKLGGMEVSLILLLIVFMLMPINAVYSRN